jgi:hypothetical protein
MRVPVVAASGSVSFAEFFLILLGLLIVLLVAAVVVARRTRAQDAFRHNTAIGAFEPGVVGNLQERVEQAGSGHDDALRWVEAFLRDAVVDAVALRRGLPKTEAADLVDEAPPQDLPPTVVSFLDGASSRRRWKLRKADGVRPRIPRDFSVLRIVMPLHVSRTELVLQDIEQLLNTLEDYATVDRT